MRSFAAAAILAVIIVISGIISSAKIDSVANKLHSDADILYSCLKENDNAGAMNAINSAEEVFKKHKVLLEATSNHEEILRIELSYGHVREFIENDQIGDALASCNEIKRLIKHLPSNFKLKAENIL